MKILKTAAAVLAAKLDVEAALLLADLEKLQSATPGRVSPTMAKRCLEDVRDLGTNEQLWQAIQFTDRFFAGFPRRMDVLIDLRELVGDVHKAAAC